MSDEPPPPTADAPRADLPPPRKHVLDLSQVVPGWVALVVGGLVAAGVAWLWASDLGGRDHDVAVAEAEAMCAIRERLSCDLPTVDYTGPIVLAIVGGFMVLVGVILRGQQRR